MTTSAERLNNSRVQRAFIAAIGVGVALNLILVVVAWALGDSLAIAGALVALPLSLIVTLPTLVTAFYGTSGGFNRLAVSVLGTWLVKMVGLIGAVLILRGQEWLSLPWLGIGLLVGAVIPTFVEVALLMRHRPRLEVSDHM